RVDGDVARARHHAGATVEGGPPGSQRLLDEVGDAVAGRLLPHEGATPGRVLAGDHAALVAVRDPLVLAEQVADLAAAHPDVASGHVGVLTEVPGELHHEALAEAHDLVVAAPLGVEVCAALGPADRQPGEGVLEDLLEPE